MPSTYSPNLRIELIAQGEQANTWGITTNNNLGTLIGEAIAGLVDVSVTASDVVLTELDGLSDQSRNMMITISGSPGVPRTVSCPDGNTKVYVVANDSNAVVTFSTVSGTGVDIPVGTSKFLYCDGTDVFEAVTAIDTLLLGGAPTTSLEAANKGYVDAAIAAINYTANRAVVTNGSGNLAASATTATEIGYVSGVTSAIQTQLNNKPSLTGSGASGTWGINISGNAATVTNGLTTSNYNSYAPTLTGGGASGTWGINISGNAATVTNGLTTSNYNSYAPTLTGGGASGTWGINISGSSAACSGNAATASSPASGGSFITSSNIGSQSVNYANSAGSATNATNATYATSPASGGSFITSSNIGSQSVNYANSAGSASTATNATNATYATYAGAGQGPVSVTSGTTLITGIPSGVYNIVVDVYNVSQGNTGSWYLQVGNGSIVTTGYWNSDNPAMQSGFVSTPANTAARAMSFRLTRQYGTNNWLCHVTGTYLTGSIAYGTNAVEFGAISLGGTLDRLQLRTGASVTAGGTMSVRYW